MLQALGWLPFVLVGLPAGVWVDRLRRRPILIAADLGRALILLAVPISYLIGALSVWQLFVVAFAVGILDVFFDVADQSYLPSLVEHHRLVEANSALELSLDFAD